MAIIEGKIETLKHIKSKLDLNGVNRFKSIGEIQSFLKNFDKERGEISLIIGTEFANEIAQLSIDLDKAQLEYSESRSSVEHEINQEISQLGERLISITGSNNKGLVSRIIKSFRIRFLNSRIKKLDKNTEKIVVERTKVAYEKFMSFKAKLDDYTLNEKEIISGRLMIAINELERTKSIIDSISNLVAGAIGENSVVKEIENLPNSFYLLNDFSVKFDPPIYNKNENDRIYSIQIDHLLVSQSGLFIIETKNWSQHSINNIDLRSPVKQITRANYALFCMLNGNSNDKIGVSGHHWGSIKIPIRNIIVMTNAKPHEDFKHVKVLSLNDLNNYITYFDPIFSPAEVENIATNLKKYCDV